jgi:hypothetical protein
MDDFAGMLRSHLKKRILVQGQGGRENQPGGIHRVFRGVDMSAQRRDWAKRLFCECF